MSGFVYNKTTKRLVGGHQRSKVLPEDAEIKIERVFNIPTVSKTVAEGVIIVGGERFKYREVEADEVWETEAMIAANKHGGEWDNLEELIRSVPDLNLELIGFSIPEIKELNIEVKPIEVKDFEQNEIENKENKKKKEEHQDEVPEVPKVVKSKLGELWILGNHRLLIGDCTEEKNILKLMGELKGDLVFTDPPYNVASHSKNYTADFSKGMETLSKAEWDKDCNIEKLLSMIPYCVDDSFTAYIWTSQFLIQRIWDLFKGKDYVSYLVWNKTNPLPSMSKRHPCWNTELCVYVAHGKNRIFNHTEGQNFLSCRTHSRVSDGSHPTMKPVDLIVPIIQASSNPGSIVVDLFCGSGSTIIACEQTKRHCFGMELNPEYADIILSRWAKFTGKDPIREDGTKWSSL